MDLADLSLVYAGMLPLLQVAFVSLLVPIQDILTLVLRHKQVHFHSLFLGSTLPSLRYLLTYTVPRRSSSLFTDPGAILHSLEVHNRIYSSRSQTSCMSLCSSFPFSAHIKRVFCTSCSPLLSHVPAHTDDLVMSLPASRR